MRSVKFSTITGGLFIFFSMLMAYQAQGQAAILALLFGDKVASETFNISLEAGGTFTSYSNIENKERARLGINFGIAGNIMLNKNWFLSPNIYFLANRKLRLSSYSLETGNDNLDSEFMNVPTSIDIRYIDVPIFISYQTNNKKFRYGLAPQVSFLQSSKATFTGTSGDFVQDFKPVMNTVDYGIVADFAYILGQAHKGRGVHLHARFYYGLSDIFKDEFSSNQNRSTFFSLHLSLPFITDELAAKNLEENRD